MFHFYEKVLPRLSREIDRLNLLRGSERFFCLLLIIINYLLKYLNNIVASYNFVVTIICNYYYDFEQ